MFDFDKAEHKIIDDPNHICNGRIYRARLNHFINSQGHVIQTTKMVPMKRLSCPGCTKCAYIDEYLNEDVVNDTLQYPKSIQHGELYVLVGEGSAPTYDDDGEFYLVFKRHKKQKDGK